MMLVTRRCRAIHLLQILGHPLAENDKLCDPEFLSEVMEVQEDLESCDILALRAHVTLNRARLQHEHALVSAAFSSGRVEDAKAIVIKMQCESLFLSFSNPFFLSISFSALTQSPCIFSFPFVMCLQIAGT